MITRLENDYGVVRFNDEVSIESMFQLTDEIDFLVDYYQYKLVRIEINSPGGALRALRFFLDKLNFWREKGVVIETLALCDVASAAALMLCLGDIGHRYAMPNAKVLFHGVRVNGLDNVTVEKTASLMESLKKTDDSIMQELIEHIMPGDKDTTYPHEEVKVQSTKFTVKTYKTIAGRNSATKKLLQKLFVLEAYLDVEQLKKFRFIDSALVGGVA